MRVLYLNHNVVGSGTFNRAYHLGRELVHRGHHVTLVTTSRAARFRVRTNSFDGVEVVEAPDLLLGRGRTGWDPYNTLVRMSALRARTFDLVHAFDSRPAVIYPALAVVKRTGAPLFMDWADWWGRGGWIQERSGWAVRTLFGPIETWFEEAYRTRALALTTISTALRERSIALGVTPSMVACIQQGCDPARVKPLTRSAARAHLNLGDEPTIVHVGVLTQGDLLFLKQAFTGVRARHPRAKLVLAGRTAIRVRAEAGMVVTGEISADTLLNWLGAADLCVIPTRDTIGNRGRWPSKLNDYLAAGRAVVMPRVGDAAEFIYQHGAGWTTACDAAAFGAGISDGLLDADRRGQAEAVARQLAETKLAWQTIAQDLVEFYRRAGIEA